MTLAAVALIPIKLGHIFQFGEFRVDPLTRTLRRSDIPVTLNRRAFDVLLYLVQNPGRVVTKDELLKHIWPDAFVEENNLSQSISALRRALAERPGRDSCITTLPGRGYQFIAPVRELAEPGNSDEPVNSADLTTSAELTTPPDPPPAAHSSASLNGHAHTAARVIASLRAPALSAAASARPAARPASGGFLVHNQQRTITIRSESHSQDRPWPQHALVAGIAVLSLAAAGYAVWRHVHPAPTEATVVLADFLNSTGDPTFDRTLHRALEIDLSQSPYMDVMSAQAVVEELQRMGRKGDAVLDPDLAQQVCERNNRQAVLTGTIAAIGSKYLLTLEATACGNGGKLAAAKAEASSREDVLNALDELADKVRSRLGESAASVESYQVPIVKATTPSLDALKAYSIGSDMEAQSRPETDILPLFQRAVELDPNFAMAYAAIATQFYNLSEYKLASQFYRKAFDLSGNVSAKEKLVIQAHFYAEGQQDLQQGIKVYQLWTATYPRDWTPWLDLANAYTQLGQYDAAVTAAQRALKLEPNRAVNYTVLARACKRANRLADARAIAQEAIRRGKDSTGLHGTLYTIAWQEHDQDALDRETRWGIASGDWYAEYLQGLAAASEGRYKRSMELLQTAVGLARRQNLPESADEMLTDQAAIQIWFGLPQAARATIGNIGVADHDLLDVALLHAELGAQLGDSAEAEAFLAVNGGGTHPGTLRTYIKLPELRAQLDVAKGRPAEAIAALDPVRPYDLAGYDILSLRGRAYLLSKQPALAAAQYTRLLANQSISFGPLYPLAHLGLARAYALGGNKDARAEYQAFLTAWKDADPDLPILRAAKDEYARLPAAGGGQ